MKSFNDDSSFLDRLFTDEQGRLALSVEGLGLGSDKPFFIDWSGGASHYRAQRCQHEMVVRAVLGKQRTTHQVIDCTAGLGRDALILASQGLRVTLLERSEVIYRLLHDAMQRASVLPEWAPVLSRMTLLHADAADWLLSDVATSLFSEGGATAIYCDPMFPQRNKRAKVKKEMQVFQALLTERSVDEVQGEEVERLVSMALSLLPGRKDGRLVVKRPLKAGAFVKAPSYSLKGKTVRFDVYQK